MIKIRIAYIYDMNSNLFFKISNKIKLFLHDNKICFIIIFIFFLFGLIFGIYSGIVLCEDLTLDDLTDTQFITFLEGEGSFLGFFFERLIFLILPIIILFFINHILMCPVIFYFCLARTYFFAFNLTILFYHLNVFGLLYLLIVALPCYLLYCFLTLPCYVVLLKRIFVTRKQKISNCEYRLISKQLAKIILFLILILALIILYETTFLFIIFNKYVFSV